ncbi:unnamed protein product [Bursaphelenchus okinawaensis]|uniref:Ground-like domain-containing protein n=1 Tax=Bursaphelenchus okinawaensis TaxID=465554 RepID=A0A811KG32_9BILA|nr:unnamed protein product [Bursaphelenchus okinawaensis]CAG9102439.1 unnamed protein product [Bursaphelenchus okinawaensis]
MNLVSSSLLLLLYFNWADCSIFKSKLFKRQSDLPLANVFTPNNQGKGLDLNRCNSESLEKIMLENIGDDVKQSKLRIMEAAEATLGGAFNVVCAHGDFSYITSTKLYCLTGTDAVKCYAFLSFSSDSE